MIDLVEVERVAPVRGLLLSVYRALQFLFLLVAEPITVLRPTRSLRGHGA